MDSNDDFAKCSCPLLLNPIKYTPDSVDLLKDEEARIYWLKCLEGLGNQFEEKAKFLNPTDPTAPQRARKCKEAFHQILQRLKEDPSLLGELSVRSLLDLNEEIIRENGFKDAWNHQKQLETMGALRNVPGRLLEIDSIGNDDEKWKELCRGVIAGNMFDWGAKAILDLFENHVDFGLNDALSKIQPRPWLVDDLDKWITRLHGDPYHSVVIFVDNAGIDLILGILPLARQFLRMGTQVILSANSKPAINDVTNKECEFYFHSAAESCSVLRNALVNKKLLFYESGGVGPCLDLKNLHTDLCSAMSGADLIILEGMGRAVHTNLYARFTVDCLKVAVIKNEWWARRLGGEKFSVLFQYEPKT